MVETFSCMTNIFVQKYSTLWPTALWEFGSWKLLISDHNLVSKKYIWKNSHFCFCWYGNTKLSVTILSLHSFWGFSLKRPPSALLSEENSMKAVSWSEKKGRWSITVRRKAFLPSSLITSKNTAQYCNGSVTPKV